MNVGFGRGARRDMYLAIVLAVGRYMEFSLHNEGISKTALV